MTLNGSGTDIWGTSDQFEDTHTRTASATAPSSERVASLQDTNQWAKAGVMAIAQP